MRSPLVVVTPLGVYLLLDIFQGQEQAYIQTLILEAAVRRFYKGVIYWLAGPAEVQSYFILISPFVWDQARHRASSTDRKSLR